MQQVINEISVINYLILALHYEGDLSNVDWCYRSCVYWIHGNFWTTA